MWQPNKKEEKYLRDNYLTKSARELGTALGKSPNQVYGQMAKLGLDYKCKTKEYDPALAQAQRVEKTYKRRYEEALDSVELMRKEIDALMSVGKLELYSIVESRDSGEKSEATTISLFSDLHGEEEVKPSQVNGVNKYNLDIAKKSTDDFFCVVAKLIKVHQKEYDIKNHICALLGDFISGSIHDDLKEGNKIQPTEAIWIVGGWILSGIKHLRKECPEVNLIVPCSMGNHSRITEKQRVQTEYGNSLELLLYNRLAEYFENDKMVKFLITDAYFTYVNVYGKSLAFSHGHAVRYAGGIGGITIPMNKAIAQWDKMKHSDYYFSGHFHEFCVGQNFIVNGSVIGYNPYAVKIKAGFERPTQTFALINKDRELEVIRKIILR